MRRAVTLWFLIAAAILALMFLSAPDPGQPLPAAGLPTPRLLFVAAVIGGIALFDACRTGFPGQRPTLPVYGTALLCALVMPLPAILADIISPFPRDMNLTGIAAPGFYLAAGLIALGLLFLTPLALVHRLTRRPGLAIAVAALPEAGLQAGFASGQTTGLMVFVALHLVAVGVVQGWVLRIGGLEPLLVFRFGYYLIWHGVWGQARLFLLFPA